MQLKDPSALLTWPAPNYIDPVTRGSILYIVNGVFFGLATISILTRLYARVFIRKWVGLDDILITFAWLSGAGDMTTVVWGYKNFYWDRHFWDRKNEFLVPGAQATMAAKLFWTFSSTFIRLSVLACFYRLMKHIGISNRRYWWALHLTTFLVVSIFLSFIFVIVFNCVPVQSYWRWPTNGSCINEGLALTILSAINTFSEALVASLPIPILFKLKMDQRTRLNVLSLLSLGYLVALVGSVRTVLVWHLFDTNDLTWWAAPHWIASEVEISIAIICASAPAIRPVIDRLLGRNRLIYVSMRSRHLSTFRDSTSTSMREPLNTFDMSQQYGEYWKTIDVEGIRADDMGYTVTIKAQPNLLQQQPRRRRSIFRGSQPVVDPEKNIPQNKFMLELPKPILLNRLSFGASSWGSWGFPRPPVVPGKTMAITRRESVDVMSERIGIISRNSSVLSVVEKPVTALPPLTARESRDLIFGSFYFDDDIEE